MYQENIQYTSVGIHINLMGAYVAYYRNDMSEAEILPNPETGENIWSLSCIDDRLLPAIDLKQNIQSHLNCIFEILENKVDHICFTMDELSESDVWELLPILNELDIKGATLSLRDAKESFYDFVTYQSNDLWTNEVVLLEEKAGKLSSKSLVMAAYPHDKALTVKSKEFETFSFGNEDDQTDKEFCKLLEKFFDKRLVSCVFLQGEIFSKNWMKTTLKFLCKNRRVFGVNDIIVKGACYSPFRKSFSDLKARYYMGTHQIPFNVGMIINEAGKEEMCRLVKAGTNWYEADFMWHFMINDTDVLKFRIDPQVSGLNRNIDVDISKFPHRPKFATKIEISVHFAGYDRWYIKVCDLGLGELYPSEHTEEVVYIGEW